MQTPTEQQITRAKELARMGTKDNPIVREFVIVGDYTLCLTPDGDYKYPNELDYNRPKIAVFHHRLFMGFYPVAEFTMLLWALMPDMLAFSEAAKPEINKNGMLAMTKAMFGRFDDIMDDFYGNGETPTIAAKRQQAINSNDLSDFLKIIESAK